VYSKGLWGYLPANVLQGIVGFAAIMIFTRILSPDEYGRYVLALGVSSVVYTIVFTWMESAIARFYPADRILDPLAPVLYGTLYRAFVAIALVFLTLVTVATIVWPAQNPGQEALKAAIACGLASIVSRSLLRLVQEQRRSEGRVLPASGIDMLQTGGGFALGVVFALLGMKAGAPLLGAGMAALLILPFVAREDWGRALKGRFDSSAAKSYLHYGFPISMSLVLSLALYTLDRFLIAHFMGEADVGAYHASFSIASRIIDVLFIWFGAAGVPAMIHALENGGDDTLKTEARRQIVLMAMILFPAAAGIISIAAPLSALMIGEELRTQSLTVIPMVTIGALLAGLNNGYFLLQFTLTKKTKLLVMAMSVPAILNIALNVALIPRFGLAGAAFAYAASFAFGVLASWFLGVRAVRLPVPVWLLTKAAAAAAFMAAVLMALPSFGLFLDLTAKPLIGACIYGALALAWNIGSAREWTRALAARVSAKLIHARGHG
jgi:O-antigen/teichoic acid export membrane protein